MELWDIYDAHRNKIGRTMVRGSTFEPGTYHLVIHVCIFNSKGEMLIQQRQSFKEGWPNLWDITVGGSALAGEDSHTAAHRELYEELGIDLDFQEMRPNLTVNFQHGFDDIYILEKDIDLSTLRLQYEEVQDVRWASKEEILKMIEKKAFLPYFPNFIGLLFDGRKGDGFFKE